MRTDRAPIYVVHFTQASALERAQSLLSAKLCTREERDAIAEAIGGVPLHRRVRPDAVASSSAAASASTTPGCCPRYRRLVEQLAQTGLLKVICGTDTLGVGINVPIRTVVFTGLAKFDGTRQRLLKAREFHQIAGRAGRAGFDTAGYVVVQAPEHAIENARPVAKAGDDPKKLRKLQRKKPPDGDGRLDRGDVRAAARRDARGAGLADARQPRDDPQPHQPAARTRSRRCAR